jgi:NAD+ diphosphatase
VPMKIDLSKIFKYCPACGAKSPKAHSRAKHITCAACGFLYFHNVASAGGVIIEYGSKILLAVRANEPKAGMFDLPGGFADYGEGIEQTLVREVREELGIKIKKLRYLYSAPNIYVYKGVTYTTTDITFTCKLDNPRRIKPNKDEIAAVKFFDPAKIPFNKIAFPSVKKILKFYIRLRRGR